jgi:hypothetical protein
MSGFLSLDCPQEAKTNRKNIFFTVVINNH